MIDYRLYLLDGNTIQAREEFRAPNDGDALIIATVVADACSDEHTGFELWSLARRVFGPAPAVSPLALDEISQAHQRAVLDLEEALQRSRWAIAKSRRLLEKKRELRIALEQRNAADQPVLDPLDK